MYAGLRSEPHDVEQDPVLDDLAVLDAGEVAVAQRRRAAEGRIPNSRRENTPVM